MGGDMSGFFLLPSFVQWTQEGRMSIKHASTVSDNFIAILPVLLTYEDLRTRESYPGIDRIATLAGVSPNTASTFLNTLAEWKWLHISRKPARLPGRMKHVYKMLYGAYGPQSEPTNWIRMDNALVRDGVWAVMPPSARRVYLVLRANGLREHRADGEWLNENDLDGTAAEYQFVPAKFWGSAYLTEATGLPDRTLRDAKAWLVKEGLVYSTHEHQEEGLLMPFDPQRHVPRVLKALETTRERNDTRGIAPASGYDKRGIRQLRRRTSGSERTPGATAGTRTVKKEQ